MYEMKDINAKADWKWIVYTENMVRYQDQNFSPNDCSNNFAEIYPQITSLVSPKVIEKYNGLYKLTMIYLDPTVPTKRKYPKKYDINILAPKNRQAKPHWQKLLFVYFSWKQFLRAPQVFSDLFEMLFPRWCHTEVSLSYSKFYPQKQ